jgi:DNA-binding phage protein
MTNPKDCPDDEAMAASFRVEPGLAVALLKSVMADGNPGELVNALRQITQAFGSLENLAETVELDHLRQLWEQALNDPRAGIDVGPVMDRLKQRYQDPLAAWMDNPATPLTLPVPITREQKLEALRQALIEGENSGPGTSFDVKELLAEIHRKHLKTE